MEELKMLYIAPAAELILFMPMEGIAADNDWGISLTSMDDEGGSGIGMGGGPGDGEEDPDGEGAPAN